MNQQFNHFAQIAFRSLFQRLPSGQNDFRKQTSRTWCELTICRRVIGHVHDFERVVAYHVVQDSCRAGAEIIALVSHLPENLLILYYSAPLLVSLFSIIHILSSNFLLTKTHHLMLGKKLQNRRYKLLRTVSGMERARNSCCRPECAPRAAPCASGCAGPKTARRSARRR